MAGTTVETPTQRLGKVAAALKAIPAVKAVGVSTDTAGAEYAWASVYAAPKGNGGHSGDVARTLQVTLAGSVSWVGTWSDQASEVWHRRNNTFALISMAARRALGLPPIG